MNDFLKRLYEDIGNYYTDKIIAYGAVPKGVDWNSEESQIIRFVQLTKIVTRDNFTINDIGCGYGKYFDFLKQHFKNFDYIGYDLSDEMIKVAKKLHTGEEQRFICVNKLSEIREAEYSVASGIFNVKMHYKESEWLFYILDTIDIMNKKSKKGFAFNMLTKYSDKEFMKDHLYYADPLFFFDYCKRNYSKDVALLHDYGLFDFTILVRK
ncbi:MAG: methyltransferase domain-containing protein [Fervidobacterium sp.]